MFFCLMSKGGIYVWSSFFPPTCLYTKESLMACIQQPIYYEAETKTGTLGKIKRVYIADSLTSVTAPTPLHQPPGQQKKRPSGVYRSAAAGRKRRAAWFDPIGNPRIGARSSLFRFPSVIVSETMAMPPCHKVPIYNSSPHVRPIRAISLVAYKYKAGQQQ